jgi:hypothetical protein
LSTSTPTIIPAALTAEEAAVYLGLSRQTLANWRVRGKGPAYSRLGSSARPVIVYLREDLDAYLRTRRVDTADSKAVLR